MGKPVKLHLAHRFDWTGDSRLPNVVMFCGYSAFGLSADFTTDVSTMEGLPDTKVCQNCLKSMKARGR